MKRILWLTLGCVAVTSVAHAQILQIAREPMRAQLAIEQGTMPLISERLRVEIDGQHATSKLKQVYKNRTGRVTEGRYSLKAGTGTHVDGFAYWNGEEKIVGEVFEKQAAHEVYNRVTSRGRDPGLLEKTGEGAFSFKIFPIAVNEDKRVEVTFSRWLGKQHNVVEYAAPVSSARSDIEVRLVHPQPIGAVRSRTHNIRVEKLRNGGVRVVSTGAKGNTVSKFHLSYSIDEQPWQVSSWVHKTAGHDGYFSLALSAPKLRSDAVAAKDVTLVLDRSGSMAGDNLRNAITSAVNVVRRLDPRDRVNVIAFDDDVDMLFAEPKALTEQNRQAAIQYISRIQEGGGTDIAHALEESFKAQIPGNRPRVVLFLTDGQSDSRAALQVAQADKQDVRVFTIGLGDGVEKPLLSRLAAQKRGRFTFIGSANAIERKVGTLYAQISAPVMVNVSLQVDGGRPMRVYPRSLPDLFAKDELHVSGRLRGNGPTTFILRGFVNGKPVALKSVAHRGHRPWVGKLWAKSRVGHLEEEIALHGVQEELKNEVIDLSLAYNFVTSYTAFLAIPASEISGDIADLVARARAKRQRALSQKRDAADLDNKDAEKTIATGNVRQSRGPIGGGKKGRSVSRKPAPPPSSIRAEPSPVEAEAMDSRVAPAMDDSPSDGSGDSGADYDEQALTGTSDFADAPDGYSEGGEEQGEYGDPQDPADNTPATVQSKKSGCAGCQASGSGAASGLFMVLMALMLFRRRRSRG